MKQIWKKGISVCMAVILTVSGITYSPVAGQKVIAAETEITEDYVEISTVDELYGIRNNLWGKYILRNDIDLSEATEEGGELDTGHGWTPINDFQGTFDGGGYRIKGMQIRDADENVGLFGSLSSNGTIKNLGLTDVKINIKKSDNSLVKCGSIAGSIAGSIENCFASGEITIDNGRAYVGGIAGFQDNYFSNISECYNLVNIREENSNKYSVTVGGILGNVEDTRWYGIKNCYNRGNINEGKGGPIVGADEIYENGHCYYLKGSGTDDHGGTPLTDTQMKNANYFTGFDFKDIWEVDPDSLYTYPQLKSCMQIRIKELTLETEPVKKEYNQGDTLDISGGKLQITYEDDRESTAPVTDLMVESYDMMQIGEQEIHIRKGNMTVSYTITVKAIPVTKVTLDQSSLFMERGDTQTLKAEILPSNATDQDIEWSSDNDDVATVDQNGKVRAISNGKANIIAKAANGVKAVCAVMVAVPCQRFQIDVTGNEGTITVDQGKTIPLSYTMYPESSTESVRWEIANKSIASVDAANNLKGLKPGWTQLTGWTDSGKEDSVEVLVTKSISGFTVTGIQDKNYTGYSITQNVTVKNGSTTLKKGTEYSVSYKNNVAAGTATVIITGNLPYKGTITKTFKIRAVKTTAQNTTKAKSYKPGKVTISSVKAGKRKLTIKWKKASKAEEYEVTVAQNKKFTKGKKRYYVTGRSKVFKGKRKKTYYVRVRALAYKENGMAVYGKYSSIKKKKTR